MSAEALPSVLIAEFEGFINKYCSGAIDNVVQALDRQVHYPIKIDLTLMEGFCPNGVEQLLEHPGKNIPLFETALQNVQRQRTETPKPNVHARIGRHGRYIKDSISAIRHRDVGKLITIVGTISRTGAVMLRESSREFHCKRCKHTFEVQGDVTQRGAFDLPARCPKPGEKPCFGTSFAPVEDENAQCREYQEIKLQEKVQHLLIGSIPRSMIVVLADDMVDSIKPGDDVLITGVLHRRWNRNPIPDMRADIELMLVAVDIDNSNETKSFLHVSEESLRIFNEHWDCSPTQQLSRRDVILRSLCPQIYGMYLLKLIVAMTLIGGVPYHAPSGTRIRGESHLLIVGDPGTAKSQILRYAAKIAPRSVLTTGIGTTSAGLTVTAVREAGSGEWMLDAGALVLADGGVCCIDEFDGIKQHDRGSVHEAMEQQTISVAKAGLVCILDTRATVLAAVNPKGGKISTEIGVSGEGDSTETSEFQTLQLPITVGIASPLLSRFDVILTLLDQHNEEWDRQLSSFILNDYQSSAQEREDPEIWSSDRLRQYFYHVKSNLKPKVSQNANKILTTYYRVERASESRNAARTTVRLLEALVRLAQAHARLMYRGTATAMDAVFAIAAVEASSTSLEVVGGAGALHAAFPVDAEADFERYARTILCKLGLEDEGINFYSDDAPVED